MYYVLECLWPLYETLNVYHIWLFIFLIGCVSKPLYPGPILVYFCNQSGGGAEKGAVKLLDAIGPVAFCLCLNHGLTAVPIDLIFGMHTHVMSRSIIGYIILTF